VGSTLWRAQADLAPAIQDYRDTLLRHCTAICAHLDMGTIVVLVEGWFAIRTAERHFLSPEDAAKLSEQGRRDLFVTWLSMLARKHGAVPAAILRLVNTYDILGPYALERVWTEVEGHLGVLYGAIPLMQAAAAREEPGAAARLETALGAAVKLSWQYLPQTLRAKAGRRGSDYDEVCGLVFEAVAITLKKRVNPAQDSLAAAISSLGGRFDVLPLAVGNVVSRHLFREATRGADGNHCARCHGILLFVSDVVAGQGSR
jgi:hypothetical protein